MKRIFLFLVVMVLPMVAIAQDAPENTNGTTGEAQEGAGGIAWNMTDFAMNAPGNGQTFLYRPALQTRLYRVFLNAGWGSVFSDGRVSDGRRGRFYDPSLYRGGLGFEISGLYMDISYARDLPRLNFAFYGVQAGVDARIGYTFDSGIAIENYVFYGSLDHLGVSDTSFLYNQVSAFGPLYYGIDSDLSWRSDISFYRPRGSDWRWGMYNALSLTLFDNMVASRLGVGYVSSGRDGIANTMRYDFSAFAPGFTPGVVVGNYSAALENSLRLFPLRELPIPHLSEMLYIAAFANGGTFLEEGKLLENTRFVSMAGASVGLVLFGLDMSFNYGYSQETGWVFMFQMRDIRVY